MNNGFGGEVAQFYLRHRRDYPPSTVDDLVARFGLGAGDLVLDLGCGSGQLTLPLAARVGAVLGIDPEPDMLAVGRARGGPANVGWLVGADTDLPAVAAVLGDRRAGAVTIGTAIHLMQPEPLFAAVRPLLRPGGGLAILSHGLPVWQQDSAWSRALRDCLAGWLGKPLVSCCGTDEQARARYRAMLAAAGYRDVRETVTGYSDEIDLDHLIGHLYSAMGGALPDAADRPAFRDRVARAVLPYGPLVEQVRVRVLAALAG